MREAYQLIYEILEEKQDPDQLVAFASSIFFGVDIIGIDFSDIAMNCLYSAYQIQKCKNAPIGLIKYHWYEANIETFNHDPRFAEIKAWEMSFLKRRKDKVRIALGGSENFPMNRFSLRERLEKAMGVKPRNRLDYMGFCKEFDVTFQFESEKKACEILDQLFLRCEKTGFKMLLKERDLISMLSHAVSLTFEYLELSESLNYLIRYQKILKNYPIPLRGIHELSKKIFDNFEKLEVKKIYSRFLLVLSEEDQFELKVELSRMFFDAGKMNWSLYFLNGFNLEDWYFFLAHHISDFEKLGIEREVFVTPDLDSFFYKVF